jgi:hypothetical protein
LFPAKFYFALIFSRRTQARGHAMAGAVTRSAMKLPPQSRSQIKFGNESSCDETSNPERDLCESRFSTEMSRQGQVKVARRFIAGYRLESEARPGGTVELHLWKRPSSVPMGRSAWLQQTPAINCRATFNHSYGMIGNQTFAEVSERVQSIPENGAAIQPFQGCARMKITQGRRYCSNPGLNDFHPVRMKRP